MARMRNTDPTLEAREKAQEQLRESRDAHQAEVERLRALLVDIDAACYEAKESRELYGEGEGKTVLDCLDRVQALAQQRDPQGSGEPVAKPLADSVEASPPVATKEEEPA